MSKVASFISLAIIQLDPTAAEPLHRQLYNSLRKAILQQQLTAGQRLPSTRALAEELNVSRNTIVNAYEQLLAEGYVESQVGSGTHVTHTLPEETLQLQRQPARNLVFTTAVVPPHLSKRGAAIEELSFSDGSRPRPFRVGLPALDAFPFKLWEKLLLHSWREITAAQMGYGVVAGYRPLREALATYLQGARGVRCTAEQIIITNGTQQAIALTAALLLNPGDTVWLENPGYSGARGAFASALAHIEPIPIDDQGLKVTAALAQAPQAKLAYITPSHQYPLGVTMSLTRRLELLHWAQEKQGWIIEDDYDSEYRYAGRPLAALQGLDNHGRVIYIGTLSKVLYPALRLGYMVVPADLVDVCRAGRAHLDRGSSLLEQVVLTKFINEGHFARHLRRMRTLYATRQNIFVEAAAEYLSGLLDVKPNDTGLHLVGWLPEGMDDEAVKDRLLKEDIEVMALSSFSMTPLKQGGLVLGYTAVPENEIVPAVKRMQRAMSN